MSKIVGVALALAIVKGGELVILYHALPTLRRLWGRLLAADNNGYLIAMRAPGNAFRRFKEMDDLKISAGSQKEDH